MIRSRITPLLFAYHKARLLHSSIRRRSRFRMPALLRS